MTDNPGRVDAAPGRGRAVRFRRNEVGGAIAAFSGAERVAAFGQLAAYAQRGALRLEVERVPFDDAASAWTRVKAGTASRKLVIVP